MTLKTSIDTLVADAAIAHSIIHGGSTATVTTEGGPVPSLAKAIADMVAYWGTLGMTLASAGTISAAPGSVGAPSLIWGGDLTTGVYRIGANNLGVAVSGAKVLDIAAAGLGVTGTLSTTGTATIGGATNAYLVDGKYGQLLAGADAGGFYFAAGFTSNAIPVFIGNAGTTEIRQSVASGGSIASYVAGVARFAAYAGSIAVNATNKLYLDGVAGTGDTYLVESSANVLDCYVGGIRAVTFNTYGLNVNNHITLGPMGATQSGLKDSYFGYGGGAYKVVQLGTLGSNRAISLGVDVSGNASAGFTGNEIVLPHSKSFIAPNAANTAFNVVFSVLTDGKLKLSNGLLNKQFDDNYLNGLLLQRAATADTWSLVQGGDNSLFIGYANNASGADANGDFTAMARINAVGDFITRATAKHYFDDGGDTYIVESAANTLDIYAGASRALRATAGGVDVGGALNLAQSTFHTSGGSTKFGYFTTNYTLAFSGASYWGVNDSANTKVLLVVKDAAPDWALAIGATGTVLQAAQKLYLDGASGVGGDTYLVESSANVLDIYAGGIKSISAASGALTLGLDASCSHTVNGTVAQTTRNNVTAFNITGATTGWTGYRVANSGGALFMGVASSTGTLFTGSTANSSALGTEGNFPLDFATNGTVRVSISGAGNVTFNGDVHLATKTPASASATGTTGTVAWDANYLYVCTATDTWKRAALATW